ncbi:MAG: HAMP domain-containing histidine kinase [Clostridia bacterium]|nr:HAMP domain-containing histidine kinase [Clostridia bacterium]
MSEEKQVKRQLLKNMLLNLITFSIIFYILGVIIFAQFKNTLYNSADNELKNSQMRELNLANEKKQVPFPDMETDEKNKLEPENSKNDLNEKSHSPRVVIIQRNENGEIESDSEINSSLNSIFESAIFNKNSIGEIYETEIEGYEYRGINYKNSDGTYKQLLINIDSEKEISKKFITNLTISFTLSLVAILVASYVLSRKTLKPIVESWKKQNQFVQDASHELRTPLSIIKIKQESLLENPESKIIDNAEDISITLKETQRLTKLIKELMEIARSDSNQIKLNKELFEADKEINDLVLLYKEIAENDGKILTTDLKYNEELYADINKLKELIVILLDNSIKYTNKGDSIDIRTYKKDNRFVLEIEDTGIGISKEAIDHVFERFYREEKSRNRQKGGMGLGLSIAYNIVMLHKGTIKYERNRDVGTKVIVTLPRK